MIPWRKDARVPRSLVFHHDIVSKEVWLFCLRCVLCFPCWPEILDLVILGFLKSWDCRHRPLQPATDNNILCHQFQNIYYWLFYVHGGKGHLTRISSSLSWLNFLFLMHTMQSKLFACFFLPFIVLCFSYTASSWWPLLPEFHDFSAITAFSHPEKHSRLNSH